MADKPEFVDMISEATRQSQAPSSRRASSSPVVKETSRLEPLAAGPLGAVADRDADAVEAQILEIQELGLRARFPRQ